MLEGFQLHPQNKILPQKYTTCLQCGTPGQPSLLRPIWRPVSSAENTFASESTLNLRWRQRGRLPALPACLPVCLPHGRRKRKRNTQASCRCPCSQLAHPSGCLRELGRKKDGVFSCPVIPPTGREDPGMPRPQLNPSSWKRSKNEGREREEQNPSREAFSAVF